MDEEAVQLRARFSRLTDEELLRVVTTERAEYRRVALDLAAAELARRGVLVPAAKPLERPAADDDTEPPGRRFFRREWVARQVPDLPELLVAGATAYVVDTLLEPGSFVLRVLLYLSSFVLFSAILRTAGKEFFPEVYERLRAEALQEAEDKAASERLKAELRGAAEGALDKLGLEWEARDVYVDSYGYHIDFYDAGGRLRAAVFERPRPPGGGWDAEAIARRLRRMADEPRRLPPVSVEDLRR